ncbi:MAG: helix-turn-helix domain-containing protein [Prochlorococcaceae cyanobacterium]|jgi:two-component system response regulator DevR
MTDSGRELLQARADLLRVLLRPHAVLVCMYPRLLVLSVQSNLRPPTTPPDLRITTSLAEATPLLEQAETPLMILATELLADGHGLELIRRAKEHSRQHRCLLVLTHNHRVVVEDARAAGTDVLVLEESVGRGGALVYGVEQLCRGRSFVDPAITAAQASPAAAGRGEGDRLRLSERERSILALVADGLSNREIGERLHIAPTTARDHVQAILRRLGVNNRAAAAVEAFRLGYLR